MGLDGTVCAFLEALRQAGRSEATIRAYRWHLARLCRWLEVRGVAGIGDVDRALLRSWGAGLWDGWSPASVKVAVCAVRSLCAWCVAERLVEVNEALVLQIPRPPRREQRTLSIEEVRAMLAVCRPDGLKGARDLALMNVLIDTGLRAAEVCRVRLVDLDRRRRRLVVVVKGGRRELAYFGRTTGEALDGWLGVRDRVVAAGVETVFVGVGARPGHPLTVSGLRCILRKVGEAAGVPGVSTHSFRRGFAVIAMEAGASTRVVQDAGRWAGIEMVERYTLGMRRGLLYETCSPADLVRGES